MDPRYYYSGQHGSLFFGSNNDARANVRDWSFSTQMATLDATTLGDTYKVPVNGIRTLTCNATVFWSSGQDPQSIKNSNTAHAMLTSLIEIRNQGANASSKPGQADEARQSMRLELRVGDGYTTKTGGRGISMEVKVVSAQMTMAHGEIFAANVQFESIGAPTEFSL